MTQELPLGPDKALQSNRLDKGDGGLQPHVPDRMKEYFTRQIEWFERLLADGEQLFSPQSCVSPADIADLSRLNAALEQERARTAEMIQFEREVRLLATEWQAAGNISPQDRAAVAELAEHAEALARRVVQSNNEVLREAGARLEVLRCAWGEVRQGREALDKYRGFVSPEAGFIDKKA